MYTPLESHPFLTCPAPLQPSPPHTLPAKRPGPPCSWPCRSMPRPQPVANPQATTALPITKPPPPVRFAYGDTWCSWALPRPTPSNGPADERAREREHFVQIIPAIAVPIAPAGAASTTLLCCGGGGGKVAGLQLRALRQCCRRMQERALTPCPLPAACWWRRLRCWAPRSALRRSGFKLAARRPPTGPTRAQQACVMVAAAASIPAASCGGGTGSSSSGRSSSPTQ
jgi:hypothetical protein